jgi:ubiquinone/menaquinone biosynthesis C-methylase UbiE
MDSQEQEKQVSGAFSSQSVVFDELTNSNAMEVEYRNIIRAHVQQFILPGEYMLELNCGTGLDAVFFAGKGLNVHATDNAPGMLEQLKQKVASQHLESSITYERCSFNQLSLKQNPVTQFDHVFSDYGGLNCAEDIRSVIRQLDPYLKPGGMAHLVFIAPICLWEWATVFKGKYRFAFRRLTKKGLRSHLEGHYFRTYYYSPASIRKAFGKKYALMQLRSMGCFMPPTFNDYFPARHPRIFKLLKQTELALNATWPFNRTGDLFIISVKKKR